MTFRPKKISTAIAATVRNAGSSIDSFVNYHLATGFDYIFIFLDNPRETYLRKFSGHDKVVITPCDAALKNRWKELKHYEHYKKFIGSEVMARQVLNAGIAVQMAIERKAGWLLHIDSDELFYSPRRSLQEHFLELEARNIREISYLNFEALPETPDITNCFKEVTLFKKNRRALNTRQLGFLRAPALRTAAAAAGFISYGNGKSAGKVGPQLRADGVHAFATTQRLSLPCMKTKNAVLRHLPVILHYPCCGFKAFWTKYRTLGAFSDTWFSLLPIASRIPFHLKARDVVAKNNKKLALEFYRKHVLAKSSDRELLLQKKILCRITGPSEICRIAGKK